LSSWKLFVSKEGPFHNKTGVDPYTFLGPTEEGRLKGVLIGIMSLGKHWAKKFLWPKENSVTVPEFLRKARE